MNGGKLQARYYWNYVLNLEETEDALKDKIMKKFNGPASKLMIIKSFQK